MALHRLRKVFLVNIEGPSVERKEKSRWLLRILLTRSVVFKQGDRIDGCTLVDENDVLAVLVRLSLGKTKDACIRIPQ